MLRRADPLEPVSRGGVEPAVRGYDALSTLELETTTVDNAYQVGDDRYPPVGERRNVQRGCVSFGTPIAAKAPRLRIGRRPGRFETCLFPGLPRARRLTPVPMAQTIRRWLWRLNGGMALLALTAWASALLGPHDDAPPIRGEPPETPREPPPWRASAHWAEITAQAQPWLGRPPVAGSTKPPPRAPAVTPGRLPLASFEVTCHIQDASGPDLVFLKSKDPAHPETYMPEEGAPDGDVAIERIAYEPRVTKITVRRGRRALHLRLRGHGKRSGSQP